MDKMKKLKLLLANIILAGVLVLGGCADAGDSSQSSSSKETTTQESAHLKIKILNAEDSSDDTSAQADSVILPVLIPQARQRLPLLRQKLRQ